MKPSRLRLAIVTWMALTAVLVALGCRRETVHDRPERVAKEFVERMQRVHGDPERAREAYELIASEGKKNLEERAHRASAVAGRKVGPEEMIAPSRFSLRFKPKRYEATIDGDTAIVTITGEVPASQRKQIRCVAEEGRWRVVLDLPALPAIQRRADSGL